MTTFYDKLQSRWREINSLLCVGLDSDVDGQFEFNKKIIDATYDSVCAYKPNTAFYEARGIEGIKALKKTCDYIRKKFPEVVLIVDAKRADIGNTNNGYVEFIFNYLGADAVTLNPYLGKEALQPFLDRGDKGNIILCRTSNSGAGEFQDTLYKQVARHVAHDWNAHHNCGLVVGATYPEELKIVRRIVKNMPLLIPGIGAQGGNIENTVKVGLDSHGYGMIINASRSVIFSKNPGQEAEKLRSEINNYRRHKP